MKTIAALMGAAALLALGGCATLFGGGSHQIMTFDSAPEGATVTFNGSIIGVTPLTVDVARMDGSTVAFKKDGYLPQSYLLHSRMNPAFLGDVICLSPLSTTIDTATNATIQYAPGRYFATLKPVAPGDPTAAERAAKLSQFIVTNYVILGSELSSQFMSSSTPPGEYLVTLIDMLGLHSVNDNGQVDVDQRKVMLSLKNLYDHTHSAPEFSNAVLAKYGLNL